MQSAIVAGFIALAFGYTMANLSGPFGIAGKVRFWLIQETRPEWMREGAECVFCWCFWGGLLGAILTAPSPEIFLAIWGGAVGLSYFALLYVGYGVN